MEILSVSLKNFKAHSDRHFQFQPGTNAICGENGAGKTSILEAIAWALFNYRGAYRNEDLIANGSASAQVMVALVSSQDGRTYEVHRCTNKGYSLYDPQLKERLSYKHIEEEIMPWLRQHLGVAPGTDLGRLFANTIGVPQGTFTADFLQSAEKRKPIFDAILKVEEYRQANQKTLSLEKYAKLEVEGLERAIAQYEESLSSWAVLQERHAHVAQEIAQNEVTLQQLQTQLKQLQQEKNQLEAQSKQVQHLETQVQKLTMQAEGKHQTLSLLEQSLQRATHAIELCQLHQESYQAFLQTDATLQELDERSRQQQIFLKQKANAQMALAQRQTELTKLTLQLEQLTQAQLEIDALQPLIQQQAQLEQQQALVLEQLQRLQTADLERQNSSKQLTTIQVELGQLTKAIAQLQALEFSVAQIPQLEQRRDRIQEQLSRIEAAKQFEAELRRSFTQGKKGRDRYVTEAEAALKILQDIQQSVPLQVSTSLKAALQAVQAGVELNTELLNSLQQILEDLAEQVSPAKLQQQLREVKAQLNAAHQQRAEFFTLEIKKAHQVYLEGEVQQLHERLNHLQSQLAAEPTWQHQREDLATQLKALDNPRGRSQLWAQELQKQPQVQTEYNRIQRIQGDIQQTITNVEQQLAGFADLEERMTEQKQLRQTHQSGYLTYLQHQNDAKSWTNLETEFQAGVAQLEALRAQQATLQAKYEQLAQNYDPQQLQQIEASYLEVKSQCDRIEGGLPQQRQLLSELEKQLASLQALAEKRDRAQVELKQKERAKRFISFARKVYKEAGPRITERYVQTISREADKLFRELLNRQNVALEWTRDYEIMVQEGAHSRRFINLSGGEQMCAALAVRLALLRILADIDIAFFDEPTTNMDRSRREHLAEAIANIKTFRQLFVISHDDTFEKVTENIILVERQV